MNAPANRPPNFDRLARAYRWLEYLTLGPLLERTRDAHIRHLLHCRHALLLGDGDGRFTARLLASAPNLTADAVDLSPAMLRLLEQRSLAHTHRLATHQADARGFIPAGRPDLVVTHFFLDCLTQPELDALISRLSPHLAPGALWLVSDFRIPTGPAGLAARVYVRLLYLAFRLLTGLRTTRLPNYQTALRRSGFALTAERHTLFGILTSELWKRTP